MCTKVVEISTWSYLEDRLSDWIVEDTERGRGTYTRGRHVTALNGAKLFAEENLAKALAKKTTSIR